MGATRGAAAARRDGAVDDGPRQDARPSRCGVSGFVYMPMGCDLPRWTPPGEGTLVELSPTLQSLAPVVDQLTVITQPRVEERLSRHARDVQRRVPERGEGEVDREHGLLPRHDGRSDRGAADRPADAAAVARAVDGPAPDGGPVRQRLRVRLSEQPLVVVADDAAAGRGASAHRLRAAVRRGRQRGRPPRGAAAGGPACSTGCSDDITRLQTTLGPEDRAQGRPVSRDRPRGGAPHPEGRGRDGRRRRCRISIGRSACRPPTPITRG